MARTPEASKSRAQKPTKRRAKSAAKAKRRVTRIVPAKRKRRTSPIDFDLPTDPNQQLIAGAIFSESTAGANANADEKRCIGLCIVNMAYYATLTQDSAKPCYNSSFGDGSILSAIKKNIYAYGSAQLKKVMDADAMKSKDDLEDSLIASEVKHLKGSVEASATAVAATAPARVPVQLQSGS